MRTSKNAFVEKDPWLSPYCHCANNPINAIDLDGREVYMEFNKSTNKLYLLDLYKKGQLFTSRFKYGTINVIGSDKIPETSK